MHLVLFDCDGTLVDSAALINETMARTFRAFGRTPPSLSETKSIIGLTLDIAIAKLKASPHVDDEAIAMTAHYKSIYAAVRADGFIEPLFSGIAPMMATLEQDQRCLLGAVTGKSRRGLVMIETSHGMERSFRVSRTADDCPSKPHPAMVSECCAEAGILPGRTVVIGDAVYDMQMAKAAGALAVGVAWGYAPVDALVAAGADRIVRDPQEILDMLETLHD